LAMTLHSFCSLKNARSVAAFCDRRFYRVNRLWLRAGLQNENHHTP
jgi:hypothetical protein